MYGGNKFLFLFIRIKRLINYTKITYLQAKQLYQMPWSAMVILYELVTYLLLIAEADLTQYNNISFNLIGFDLFLIYIRKN